MYDLSRNLWENHSEDTSYDDDEYISCEELEFADPDSDIYQTYFILVATLEEGTQRQSSEVITEGD